MAIKISYGHIKKDRKGPDGNRELPACMESVPCNLCGCTRQRRFLDKLEQTIVKCRRCGLLFTNPRLREEDLFKRYGPDYFTKECLPAYGATPESYNLDLIVNRYSLYLGILEQARLPGRRLLDVGAGAGFFVKAARQHGWGAEGIEVSEAAAAYGRDILKVKIHNKKFEDARFGDGTFDAVTLLDTIEHLRDPLGCLTGIRRILKKDGILVLNTPDIHSLSRLFLGKTWAVFSPLEHLYYFNQKTLAAMLEKAWFRIVGIRNLARFNPEYTHDKNSRRYRRWKKWHAKWDEKPIRLEIHEYEQKDVWRMVEYDRKMRSESRNEDRLSREGREEGKAVRSGTAPPPLPLKILLRRNAFTKAKSVFRGDLLIAVAGRD